MDRTISIKKLIRKNVHYAIMIILFSALTAFLSAYPLTILKKMIDDAVEASKISSIDQKFISSMIGVVLLYLGCQLGAYIINNFHNYFLKLIQAKLSHNVRCDIYNHLCTLDQSFFDESDSSELLNKLIQDSDIAIQGFISPVTNLSKALFSFAFGFYFMWTINPIITLVVLPFALVVGIVTRLSGGKFRLFAMEARRKNGIMWKSYQESIKGIRDIHASCQEDKRKQMVEDSSLEVVGNIKKTAKYALFVDFINNFCFLLIIATMLAIGGYLILHGQATVGAVMAIFTYNSLLSAPVYNFVSMFIDLFRVRISLDRINLILNTEEDFSYQSAIVDINTNTTNAIEFINVDFKYKNNNILFDNLSFEVKNHSSTAIVGATGSGKTTILKLCEGLYLYDGEIKIWNQPLNIENKLSLRQYISYAFQDTFLFNTTIKENILFAAPTASEEQLKKAIDTACVDEIIAKLPSGIDTLIGENGVKLSGGERQRIGVARALLKQPRLLLLDEATSALDNNTEKKMMHNIHHNYPDITFVIVAHRLSTIENCDLIYVLEKGKVIEQGNHHQLLIKNGLYKKMHDASSKEEEIKNEQE